MVSISISFNAKEAIAAMTTIANTGIPEGIKTALDTIANEVIIGAKDIVPVDTGNLRDSIRVLNRTQDSVTIGSDVEYAPDVEFGTSKMGARPYLGPQADRMASEGPRILGEEIGKRIQK